MSSTIATTEDRLLWSRVDKNGPLPSPYLGRCWLWTGPAANGYGSVRYEGKAWGVHRLSFMLTCGPIPEGLYLDHLCRHPACVNPAHLEPVTPRENVIRGETIVARNAQKTHCDRGHEFTPENTRIIAGGRRACRECGRMHDRAEGPKRWQREKKRRLIASLDSYTLLGLAKLGEEDERALALKELERRGVATPATVMDASRRLVEAGDRLDALLAMPDTRPSASLVIAAVGDPVDLLDAAGGQGRW